MLTLTGSTVGVVSSETVMLSSLLEGLDVVGDATPTMAINCCESTAGGSGDGEGGVYCTTIFEKKNGSLIYPDVCAGLVYTIDIFTLLGTTSVLCPFVGPTTFPICVNEPMIGADTLLT